MKIAIMSDLHDNLEAWQIINLKIEQAGITELINCGDTCAMSTLREMSDVFSGKIYSVIGNVGEREPDIDALRDLDNVTLYDAQGDIVIDGKKIAIVHKPSAATPLINSGQYDLVCHGHTHLKRWEKIGSTYVINPGTAGGMFQYPSFAILDLATMHNEFIEVTL